MESFPVSRLHAMRGVQIRDLNENKVLAADLRHLLDLLGERAIRSQWQASEVWAIEQKTGETSQEMKRLADGKTFIAGKDLHRMAHGFKQVIDGEFLAFDNSDFPWVIVRAVDSSFYEVFSTEPTVLDKVRASFQKVSDCVYAA